jgi:hypothetical protein
MSIEAPPPITPIGNARIERLAAPWCSEEIAVFEVGQRMQRSAKIARSARVDAWMTVDHAAPMPLTSIRAATRAALGLEKSPSYGDGVFRPPRAA